MLLSRSLERWKENLKMYDEKKNLVGVSKEYQWFVGPSDTSIRNILSNERRSQNESLYICKDCDLNQRVQSESRAK